MLKLLSKIKLAIYILGGGEFDMVELYVTLIIKGSRTLEQVPTVIRSKVSDMLVDIGLEELTK